MRARRIIVIAAGTLAVAVAGCGEDDFENKPRAAVPISLTGVIKDDRVTISPSREGAGPFEILISNQTDTAHTITLAGESIRERIGPVNPSDVGSIQKTLAPGTYEVRAGSERAVPREIEPAVLHIGEPRRNSNDRLLLP
jgi:hypothetical protein